MLVALYSIYKTKKTHSYCTCNVNFCSKHNECNVKSWLIIYSFTNEKIAICVAPDQPVHLSSLIWYLHCQTICRKEFHWHSADSSPQVRLHICTGWSGATLSTYGMWQMSPVVQKGLKGKHYAVNPIHTYACIIYVNLLPLK